MFRLEAPHPGYQTTILLPSPEWGDSIELTSTVNLLKAMDGTGYTYVKERSGRKRLQWDFTISRNKALELKAFLKAYFRIAMRITDHLDNKWTGYMRSNPFDFSGSGRALDFPGGEVMAISLEFEEME